MRKFLSERNVVIMLFILVLVTFSLAQEDSKKMERINSGSATQTASTLLKLKHSIEPGSDLAK